MAARGQWSGFGPTLTAACAIRHSIPLVSNNFRHFDAIPDLSYLFQRSAAASFAIVSRFPWRMSRRPSSSTELPQPNGRNQYGQD